MQLLQKEWEVLDTILRILRYFLSVLPCTNQLKDTIYCFGTCAIPVVPVFTPTYFLVVIHIPKIRIEIHGTSQQAKHPHVCLEMLKMWSASPGPLMLICQPCLQSRHFGGCRLKWVRKLCNMKNKSKAIWWILACKIFGIQVVHCFVHDTIITTTCSCEDYILAISTSRQYVSILPYVVRLESGSLKLRSTVWTCLHLDVYCISSNSFQRFLTTFQSLLCHNDEARSGSRQSWLSGATLDYPPRSAPIFGC